MAGKVLRCDHDGCTATFPAAPVRGYRWPIRTEAEKAGWTSSRRGAYSVDNDADDKIRDYCPDHVADDVAVSFWRSVTDDEPAPVLTLEVLQAAIDEIEAEATPVVERRGSTVYIDGVPTFELNMPILTRPIDWAPAAREILWPTPLQICVQEYAQEQLSRILADRPRRIGDFGA